MKANTIIIILIVAAVIGGVVFFVIKKRKSGSAGKSIRSGGFRVATPRTASPRFQIPRPPLAPPRRPPAPPRPSLKQTGLDLYQTGCNAVAAGKGVPSSIAQFACDPRANIVLQANLKAGEAIFSGGKSVVKAFGSLF